MDHKYNESTLFIIYMQSN